MSARAAYQRRLGWRINAYLAERDGRNRSDRDEPTLPASTGDPIPRAETMRGDGE